MDQILTKSGFCDHIWSGQNDEHIPPRESHPDGRFHSTRGNAQATRLACLRVDN